MELIYYPGHDERYAHISPRERGDYPDEIRFPFPFAPIKRVKNFAEMTKEDWKLYTPDTIRLAAKDISIWDATKVY